QRILPAVAYLEMAREAVRQALTGMAGIEDNAPAVQLKDVVWIRPICVVETDDGQPLPLRVDIRLVPENRPDRFQIVYEIIVVSPDGEATVHGQGVAIPGHAASHSAAPVLDLADLHNQCSQLSLTPEQCYLAYQEAGISYGPGHRGLVQVRMGRLDGEGLRPKAGPTDDPISTPTQSRQPQVLAEVRVPSAAADARFVLHPGLIDSALQAMVGFFSGSDAPTMQLAVPFA